MTHEAGSDYTDLGATCDAVDGNGTITGVGEVDDQVPGTYTLTFDYTDSGTTVQERSSWKTPVHLLLLCSETPM